MLRRFGVPRCMLMADAKLRAALGWGSKLEFRDTVRQRFLRARDRGLQRTGQDSLSKAIRAGCEPKAGAPVPDPSVRSLPLEDWEGDLISERYETRVPESPRQDELLWRLAEILRKAESPSPRKRILFRRRRPKRLALRERAARKCA